MHGCNHNLQATWHRPLPWLSTSGLAMHISTWLKSLLCSHNYKRKLSLFPISLRMHVGMGMTTDNADKQSGWSEEISPQVLDQLDQAFGPKPLYRPFLHATGGVWGWGHTNCYVSKASTHPYIHTPLTLPYYQTFNRHLWPCKCAPVSCGQLWSPFTLTVWSITFEAM